MYKMSTRTILGASFLSKHISTNNCYSSNDFLVPKTRTANAIESQADKERLFRKYVNFFSTDTNDLKSIRYQTTK